MRTDSIPDSLYLAVDIDGGNTRRRRVEHRSFVQSSLTLIETNQSQVGQRIRRIKHAFFHDIKYWELYK
jgi:hypothetical protein